MTSNLGDDGPATATTSEQLTFFPEDGGRADETALQPEPMLQRQLYKAMDQLERLQRRRQGELVPAPVNAHLAIEQ